MLIDADAIAREVVEPGTPGLAAVAAEFGPGVLHADGSLDREAVSRLVFADASLRAALNAILHPLIAERMAALERAAPAGAVVVLDVPLIAENDLAAAFDLVVVVDASRHTQLDRLVRLRGMTRSRPRPGWPPRRAGTSGWRSGRRGHRGRQLLVTGRARPSGR